MSLTQKVSKDLVAPAEEISERLLSNYNAQEQREILEGIKATIVQSYEMKIKAHRVEAEEYGLMLDTFLGKVENLDGR